MMTEPSVSEQTYRYFEQEATELLQMMDDELQRLRTDFSIQKVHRLMRAAHTLKGASASVGLQTVTETTHALESIFKALCYEDTVISLEMERLIFEGYECLQLLMSAQLDGSTLDDADILDRIAAVVAQLQEMLGDRFGQDGHLPTSTELGFDMTQSIFEVGVEQRIEALSQALENPDPQHLVDLLTNQAEVFIGLAESLDLPGFEDIAQRVLDATQQQPDRILEIAPVALENFKAAQVAVLEGDRTRGGEPSSQLQQFDSGTSTQTSDQISDQISDQTSGTIPSDQQRANKRRSASWITRPWRLLTRPIGRTDQSASTSEAKTEEWLGGQALEGQALEDQAPEGQGLEERPLEEDRSTIAEQNGIASSGETLDDNDRVDLIPLDLRTLNKEIRDGQAEEKEREYQEKNAAQVEQPQNNRAGQYATVRMSVAHIDQLAQAMGELLTYQNRQSLYNEQLLAVVKTLLSRIEQQQQQLNRHKEQSARQSWHSLQPHAMLSARASSQRRSLPVRSSFSTSGDNHRDSNRFDILELERYNEMQLLAQSCLEESIQQSENAEAIELFARQSRQVLEQQKRLLLNTRETLLSIRMVSIDETFQRIPAAIARLQSQFCEPYGKRVEVTIEGGGFLVDKAIADKLHEPLLHLVRNAFDHGIEYPEERVSQGKSAVGRITIESAQQGRYVVISVKDDGAGLDIENIRRLAVENQMMTAAEALALTPAEIARLLFEPGFSTAEQLNDISGRGVGLDAVRAQVRSLQGRVSISHEPGEGTCFTLHIPANITVAKMLLCRVQNRVYALMPEAIRHILIPAPDQIWEWEGGKTLTWQANDEEHLVPVNALSEVLNDTSSVARSRVAPNRGDFAQPSSFSPNGLSQVSSLGVSSLGVTSQHDKANGSQTANAKPVVLLHHEDSLVGLEIDQLLGEQELVISPLGKTMVPPPYLYGSSMLADGQLTLVLEGTVLAQMMLANRRDKAGADTQKADTHETATADAQAAIAEGNHQSHQAEAPLFTKKLILTIDDSITVRNALSEALQRANYQVIQAKDGAEALAQLERYPEVQAILCDIEMPGMNGFEFLKARQKSPEIASIPTVMLTSRAGNKHRALTAELDANAYLTKPYLTPQLLKTLEAVIENPIPLSNRASESDLASETTVQPPASTVGATHD